MSDTSSPPPSPAIEVLEERLRQHEQNVKWYEDTHLPKMKRELERAMETYRKALAARDDEQNKAKTIRQAVALLGEAV